MTKNAEQPIEAEILAVLDRLKMLAQEHSGQAEAREDDLAFDEAQEALTALDTLRNYVEAWL